MLWRASGNLGRDGKHVFLAILTKAAAFIQGQQRENSPTSEAYGGRAGSDRQGANRAGGDVTLPIWQAAGGGAAAAE